MRSTYEYIKNRIDAKGALSELTPEWFIPWYELLVDKWSPLSEGGGVGKVYQAKWLDSNVVKEVILAGSRETNDSLSYDSMFLTPVTTSDPNADATNAAKRAEALTIFRHEVGIGFRFSHPHVIRLFGACHVGRPFFVCQYAQNRTLVDFLRKNPDELWSKLHEAALGVQYLHARNVVHGDLKGNNIMIRSDMKATVTDFGLSSMSTNNSKTQSISGAWNWVAPECFGREAHPTFESDIYSLGMCIVEALRIVDAVRSDDMSKICLPWWCDINAVKHNARQGKVPSRPTLSKDNEWELVKRMCVLDPQKRIKISTVVDELARLTNIDNQETDNCTTSLSKAVNQGPVDVIVKARQELVRLQANACEPDAVLELYVTLCNYLEQMFGKIEVTNSNECHASFYAIVSDFNSATTKLKTSTSNFVSIAETTMRCYALRRRLDKLCDACFIA